MFLSSTHNETSQPSLSKHQAGFSLVEFMIALTLGMVVLLGVGSIFIGSQQTYRVQEDNARIQESGRYALEMIGRSIRQAGTNAEMNFNKTATTAQCNVAGVCIAIGGVNGALATPDTLTVQFYAGSEEFVPTPAPGSWIARNCTGGQAALGAVVSNAFDIAGTDLRCTGSVGGVVGGVQPLVENVQDFQVIYGIDTDVSGSTGYRSADLYVAAPTAAQWPNVVTARVCVLIQSANNNLTTSRQSYLNCAGALGTATGAAAFTTAAAGDLRLHRSFVATYNLRNRVAAAP
ncbi:Type IV pilus assembly protein PilW [Candidatus Nitrotoga sp. BS]|uniref:PilW family protein n=1 Tax=Candidatus Nitrotoga sp. BS TaxID=2890408 RepID=UPI001EF176FB|nr:PilW family protein [Candidatus Nitrotoga sp. BS]CAH1201262.1 Type IV pilus assembly protein PilW [Candidatus Nitrotoga sp. BS]